MNEESTEVTVLEPTALEVPKNVNPEEVLAYAQRCAKVAMSAIKPARIGKKDYLTFESWLVLASFYQISVGVEWTKRISETDSEGNLIEGFGARALVYNRDGRVISSAEAQCTRKENNWKNRDDYALRSMCQTRACSKALRMVLAHVAVLAGFEATPAEEMPFEGNEFSQPKGELQYDESSDAPPAEYKKVTKKTNYSVLNQNDPNNPHPPCSDCGADMKGMAHWQYLCNKCYAKSRNQ